MRSPESLAQRAAYGRAWREAHRDYHSAWRAGHRASETARLMSWRVANPDKLAAQKRRYATAHPRPSLDTTPLPSPFFGHALFDAARAIVGPDRNSGLKVWRDPLHEDLLSVAVVALIEGSDATEAVRRYRATETGWRRVTGPLLIDGIAA